MKQFIGRSGRPRAATRLALTAAVSALTMTAGAAMPVADHYTWTNLVSDQTGTAPVTDTNLVNPWGILAAPGRLIVADNHAGVATFYSPGGRPKALVIHGLDGVTDLDFGAGRHSFVISNGVHSGASMLLFATEEGILAGWNPRVDPQNAIALRDNSGAGASYKSMTVALTRQGPRLFAANFGQEMVEIYDGNLNLLSSFTDESLATNRFVPFGLRIINGHLFVTFAFKAAPGDDDETAGPGLGYVDEFDFSGNLMRRFASQGTLNAPWGLELAPRKFGKFANALLVGNFGDGAINAYNADTGTFLGQLTDSAGNAIHIEGLWGLVSPGGRKGSTIYFTAGPFDENDGRLGIITPVRSGHHMGM